MKILVMLTFIFLLNISNTAVAKDDAGQKYFEEAKSYTVKIKSSIDIPFSADTKGTFSGAGFVIDPQKNWVITNAHVISRSPSILKVSEYQGEYKNAKPIFIDPYVDVAIIEVPGLKSKGKADLECGDIPNVGTPVGAFGHPYDFSYTGTKGIISSRESEIENLNGEYLQTDASVNPGNSGGPLINLTNGKVIGINTAGFKQSQNTNFAIPAALVCRILDLVKNKKDATPPDRPFAFSIDEDGRGGTKVAKILNTSSTFEIKEGDTILAVIAENGKEIHVKNEAQFLNATRGLVDKLTIKIKRGKEILTLGGKLQHHQPVLEQNGLFISGGLISENFNPELQSLIKFNSQVTAVIEFQYIESGSQAENVGIQKGDAIYKLNNEKVSSYKDLVEKIESLGKTNSRVKLTIIRVGGGSHFLNYFDKYFEVKNFRLIGFQDVSHRIPASPDWRSDETK